MKKPFDDAEPPDTPFDISLRPPAFSEFAGQDKVRERLELLVAAAKGRGDVLEHVLLSGPPGLGKTTLAYIIAKSMGVNIKSTSGPVIEKAGDLAGLLTTLRTRRRALHRRDPPAPGTIEEYLYPAMEDFRLDIIIDQGPNARSVRLNLPRFTLIGATTRAGMISAPLRSRFGMDCRLDYYPAEHLASIVERAAGLMDVAIDAAGRVGDRRAAPGARRASPTTCCAGCATTRRCVPTGGSTARWPTPRWPCATSTRTASTRWTSACIEALIHKFEGGPVGLNSLAVAIGEEAGTLEEVHEPYLIMQGYLKRTPQGRVAMPKAYDKLGLKVPPGKGGGQVELFT